MNSDNKAPAGTEATVATTLATAADPVAAAPSAGAGDRSSTTTGATPAEGEPVKRRRTSKVAAESIDVSGEPAAPAVRRTRKAVADVVDPVVMAGTDQDAADRAAIAAALREQAAAAAAARPPRKSTRKKADVAASPEAVAASDVAPPSQPVVESVALAAPVQASAPLAVVAPDPAPVVHPGTASDRDGEVEPAASAQPVVDSAPAHVPAPAVATVEASPAVANVAVDNGAAESAQSGAPTSGDEGQRPEGSRRQRDRARRRERNGEVDGPAAGAATGGQGAGDDTSAEGAVGGPAGVFVVAPPEPSVLDQVDAADRYADVVSGDYDVDEVPAGEVVEAVDPGKRVLRPEPEAPKLHKVLAQAGIGSRRDMEELIADGRVTVNDEVAHLGMRITYGDLIKVGGKPVKYRIAPPVARVLAYHKPVGEVVTHHDPEGRPTVFRQLPRLPQGKWLSVGRLDINTEGLLLFTNSGDLAHQLMHPKFGVDREYAVRVLGTLSDEARARLLDGVDIEGQKAAFKSIDNGAGEGANHWYRVVIGEGRNREVRKLFDSVGLGVSRLIRIRYGQMVLPRGLKRGVWVELGEQDVNQVRQLVGMGGGLREGQRDGQRDGQREGPRDGQRGAGPRGEGQRPPRDDGPRQQRDDGNGKQRGNKPGPQGQGQGQGQQQRFQAGAQGGHQQGFGGGPQPGGQRGGQGQGQGQQRPQQGQGGGGNWGQGPEGQQRGPKPGRKGQGPQQGGGNWGNDRPQQQDRPGFERRDDANGNVAANPRAPADARDDDNFDDDRPLRIPNPLEQTFDRRFATGSKRITAGFGRPSDAIPDNGPRGGPKQPDPMQTSVGYIGADAYFTRPGGGNKNRGGRRR
jgi:23S rRNA pseudouridine2605 synthase